MLDLLEKKPVFNPNEWRPEPISKTLFLSIPTTVKEAFYGGGAGSGKSDVLLLYGIVHRWHEHPKVQASVHASNIS